MNINLSERLEHHKLLKTMRNLEKSEEYNVPQHLVYINFHKAFDTLELWTRYQGLNNARIDSRYSALIKDMYSNTAIQIKIEDKYPSHFRCEDDNIL